MAGRGRLPRRAAPLNAAARRPRRPRRPRRRRPRVSRRGRGWSGHLGIHAVWACTGCWCVGGGPGPPAAGHPPPLLGGWVRKRPPPCRGLGRFRVQTFRSVAARPAATFPSCVTCLDFVFDSTLIAPRPRRWQLCFSSLTLPRVRLRRIRQNAEAQSRGLRLKRDACVAPVCVAATSTDQRGGGDSVVGRCDVSRQTSTCIAAV